MSEHIFDAGGPPLPQLSRTVVPSAEVIGLVIGCFRYPGQREVLVARRSALQVYSEDLQPLRPLQPLFGEIADIQRHAAADCIGLEVISLSVLQNSKCSTLLHELLMYLELLSLPFHQITLLTWTVHGIPCIP